MSSLRALVLLPLMTLACSAGQNDTNGAAQGSSTTSAARGAPGEVVRALKANRVASDGRVLAELRSGDTVESDAWFALEIMVDSPRYVYAVQFHADGVADLLFDGSERPAVPNVWFRVPDDPRDAFHTDFCTGEEHIYLITSPKPLREVDKELAAALDSVVKDTSAECPAPPHPEPTASVQPAPIPTVSASASAPQKLLRAPSVAAVKAEQKIQVRDKGIRRERLPNVGGTAFSGKPSDDGITVDSFVLQHR
ncbi:MAG: hypothetical protein U0271_26995 [Polyangiaceae bacterium]